VEIRHVVDIAVDGIASDLVHDTNMRTRSDMLSAQNWKGWLHKMVASQSMLDDTPHAKHSRKNAPKARKATDLVIFRHSNILTRAAREEEELPLKQLGEFGNLDDVGGFPPGSVVGIRIYPSLISGDMVVVAT
jgi:hypothetical protein